MRELISNRKRRIRLVILGLIITLLLGIVFQRYRPSLEYLAYRWEGGVTNVQGLRIKLAPGWYPKTFGPPRNNFQSFVKIQDWWLPSDPHAPYEATLEVFYKPQRNLPQANIEHMAVGRRHLSWGDLWIMSPRQPEIEPSMAYALPGGKLSIYFTRPEDLDAIESVAVP